MNINATFLGQMIAMAFFLWFCSKYVWPLFAAILEERKKKIADGLEAAARAEKDLEIAQVKSNEQLKEAKAEAAAIIDQANKRAAQIVDEAKEQAREEGQRIIAGAIRMCRQRRTTLSAARLMRLASTVTWHQRVQHLARLPRRHVITARCNTRRTRAASEITMIGSKQTATE